jgi:Ras family protein T1
VPEVTIPPEVTPENVTMHIMDSSGKRAGKDKAKSGHTTYTLFDQPLIIARPEHRELLEIEIRKAHVICIVYAIDDPNTFSRLALHWLPYIRSLGVNVSDHDHILEYVLCRLIPFLSNPLVYVAALVAAKIGTFYPCR